VAAELIGRNLRRIRQRKELSQEQAAGLASIHPKHLQRIEGGKVNVTLVTLVALAEAYGVALRDLLLARPKRSR